MQLTEIIEQLAQSCAFTTINGRLTQVEDANRVVLPPGSVVDSKYRVVRLIGQGGMGAIYKAHPVKMQRKEKRPVRFHFTEGIPGASSNQMQACEGKSCPVPGSFRHY